MELTTDNIQELNRDLIEIISSIKTLEDCGDKLIMDSDDVAEMFGWSRAGFKKNKVSLQHERKIRRKF